jgi:two-component system sensor histidine kinase/response regulator
VSQTGLLEQRSATGTGRATLLWLAVPVTVLLAVLGLYFNANNGTPDAMVVGDFAILVAAALAGRSCAHAARRGGVNARAWTLMAVAAYVWAAGMLIWSYFGLAYNHA